MSDLPAGRELDALVAEKVMGRKVKYVSDGRPFNLPLYSADIEAAWEVVERVKNTDEIGVGFGHGFYVEWSTSRWGDLPGWWAGVITTGDGGGDEQHPLASGDTAPLAICRAALELVTRYGSER